MLRNTGNTDAYIVEYGFLDSTKDDVAKLKNNWQDFSISLIISVFILVVLALSKNIITLTLLHIVHLSFSKFYRLLC